MSTLNAVRNHFEMQSPIAGALFNAKEKLTFCAETTQKLSRSFFATLGLGEKSWELSQSFAAGASQTAQTAGQTLSVAAGGAVVASLAQAFFFTIRSGLGVYKCANAIKNRDLDNGIFYGLIYTPGKIAGALGNSMSSVQQIILLQAGHVTPIFATVGAIASLAQSTFMLISGFYEIFSACMFSKELRESGDNPTEWLLQQAFIRSNKEFDKILNLPEAAQQEALNQLLKQQKESFIRRTSPECYNEMVEYFFGINLELSKEEIPTITVARLNKELAASKPPEAQENLNKLAEPAPAEAKKTQENLNKLLETVYRTNFQRKILAGIKIISAALACGACIALIVFSGGLGLLLVAGILLIITSFLRAGSNATDLHEAIGKFIWSYQKHRILPQNLADKISEEDKTKQTTTEQVKFVALTILGALTFPIWLLPATVGFQIKGVWNRMHRAESTGEKADELFRDAVNQPEAAQYAQEVVTK